MLRASVETEGAEADYRGIADGESAEQSSVPGAGALVGLVDAVLSSVEPTEADAARARVRRELGSEALVDAAGVIGNFERMTRIADSTGIPLDAPVLVLTESTRTELGIDRYGHADGQRRVTAWQRLLARMLNPLLRFGLRWLGRRNRARAVARAEGEHG